MSLAEASKKAAAKAPVIAVLAITAGVAVLAFYAWRAFVTYLLPDEISFTIADRSMTLANIHGKALGGFIISLLFTGAAFLVEMICVGWTQSSVHRLLFQPTRSAWLDMGYFVLDQLQIARFIAIVLTLGLIVVSGEWLRAELHDHFGLRFALAELPLLPQLAAGFLIYTFCDYWAHRLSHTRAFWPLHRFHHSAEEFYVITAGRVHPADLVGLLLSVPLILTGPSPFVLATVFLVTGYVRLIIHSRIDSDFGWVGRWLVQSPVHHRLHHVYDISKVPVGHFGIMPLWDRVFGTWRGDADQSLVIGIDHPYRQGLWAMPDLLRDYRDFLLAIVGKKAPAQAWGVAEESKAAPVAPNSPLEPAAAVVAAAANDAIAPPPEPANDSAAAGRRRRRG